MDGTIYSCPSLLSSFHAIFFADLKKYKFIYHFAFPALHSDPAWKYASTASESIHTLTDAESLHLFEAVNTWKYSVDQRQHGFFIAKRRRQTGILDEPEGDPNEPDESDESEEDTQDDPETPEADDLGFKWVVGSLASFETGFFNGIGAEDQYIGFADPSTYAQNPGWMLRNLLVLVRQRWKLDKVQILCYRDIHSRREKANSIILSLQCPPHEVSTGALQMPKITGWERNDQNKLNSKTVDLAEYMDPRRLADQSVDLNLKLMKWRIAPELNLDAIKNTKCLLLGAGTLGSYVSRNLLGWGVRKITLVDNARVSFSNPVRQPLFVFKDCLAGGAKKAERAAEALKEIYPGVDAQGHVMNVPMAGHPIIDEKRVKQEFDTLKRLIDEHDAIFLLMDTRESRWLPTVMGKSAGKIVMNAALGFDTYVVMRHGAKIDDSTKGSTPNGQQHQESLGCYFCNDVVAPADVSCHGLIHQNTTLKAPTNQNPPPFLQSLTDRTLDQQCTVTRPGIASLASALLVELLASILQHPLRAHAPAPASRSSSTAPSSQVLGLTPHTIRGYLSSFDNLLIKGPAYDCCSACSPGIVQAYEEDGWEFVKKALGEKGFVEEVSGLKEVQRRAEEMDGEVEWEESDEGEEEEGEGELV